MRHALTVCSLCGACAVAWIGWGGVQAFSQEGRAGSSKGSATSNVDRVHLPQCRILLPKNVRLAADRPGVIAFIGPEEGDRVNARQQLARLRDEVAQANVGVAALLAEIDIDVRYAKKVQQYDTVNLDRALEANRKLPNAVPELEVEEMRLAKEKSFLQIEKAEHDLKVNQLKLQEAEAELKTYHVEAPFDGIVTRIFKRPGEAVRQGDTILEMVNTDLVQVEGDVDLKNVYAVREGAKVIVQLDVPGDDLEVEKQEFEGRIGFVDVTVTTATNTVRVWAEVENRDNILRGGGIAKMTIFPDDVVAPTKKGGAEAPRPRQSSNSPRTRAN